MGAVLNMSIPNGFPGTIYYKLLDGDGSSVT
jgi:hypothetical protein